MHFVGCTFLIRLYHFNLTGACGCKGLDLYKYLGMYIYKLFQTCLRISEREKHLTETNLKLYVEIKLVYLPQIKLKYFTASNGYTEDSQSAKKNTN